MKKVILFACVISLFAACFTACGKSDEQLVADYLKNRYEREFVILSPVENYDEDVFFEFKASPKSNLAIVFNVGRELSDDISNFPFTFPKREKVFFDDFPERVKEVLQKDLKYELVIESESDIEECVEKIYGLLSDMNDGLAEYGIIPTTFSPGMVLDVVIKGEKHQVDFFALDRNTIERLLFEVYDNQQCS